MSHLRPSAEPATSEREPGDSPDAREEEVRALRERVAALETAVNHSDDTMTTVFSMLAHELRSPLQSLLLNAGVCLDRLRLDGAAAPSAGWLTEKLEKQRRNATRLKTLIDTFLDVGQIAAGRLRIDRQPVDLGEVVSDVVRRSQDDLTWAGCSCQLQAAPGVIGQWDPLQIDLVTSNLLSNALKYGAGRPIEVEVWGTEEAGFLRVSDHGPGIPRAEHRRIFEKFARLVSPSNVGGFGLGLWIVKHIVEAFQGSIDLESDVGRGARFTVSLPRQPA